MKAKVLLNKSNVVFNNFVEIDRNISRNFYKAKKEKMSRKNINLI